MKRVLVANRGEIACRIMRTLRAMGLESVAVFSDADASAMHVRVADQAVAIGPSAPAASYLKVERIVDAAVATGADAVHPGYGFLSEDPRLVDALEDAGVGFCGPTADQIRAFGLKDAARGLARRCGIQLLPGTDPLPDVSAALRAAQRIRFPLILKSTAGGGGIGMAVCESDAELTDAFTRVTHLSRSNFGSSDVFLERYLPRARHIEVQIFGDGRGRVVALGERDCSLQRRNQKVLEETPAPGIDDRLRRALADAAAGLGEHVAYRSAGTVEFLVDADTHEPFFLEVNTRLQVEHGVTEAVLGIDLVAWMVRLTAGEDVITEASDLQPTGYAIEARVYAEDPARGFRPGVGTLSHVAFPDGVRCDTWVESGTEVTPHYDPLLAKLVVHAPDRRGAVDDLARALDATQIWGIETNLPLLREAVRSGPFADGTPTTATLSGVATRTATVEVLAPGLFSSLQDVPGRLGAWDVGVPPSGPMDDRSHRIANALLDNPPDAPVLEMTRMGPTLRFAVAADVCLTGADMCATLDGAPVARNVPVRVGAGTTLVLGAVAGAGARAYLGVRGGFQAPPYLGSRSTFVLGGFGGHAGRTLRTGDVLRLVDDPCLPAGSIPVPIAPPQITAAWTLGVLEGPHAAPDFFTLDDIATILAAEWRVHHNSDRTGTRLIGPRPRWARPDGGDAGLHPSNIHDTPYAVGAVDFTGDMPVVLGPDGPSLGGFVCPVTVARHERWKLGQMSPGDTVRFTLLDADDARGEAMLADRTLTSRPARVARRPPTLGRAVLHRDGGDADRPEVVYRRSGDANLLVEFGPQTLDIGLRMHAHALMSALQDDPPEGLIDLTPGVRSLQVHVDPQVSSVEAALATTRAAERRIGAVDDVTVPSRTVHLPLAWEDDAALAAVERYMHSVRPDAPWCPDNVEFIRRINGLDHVDDVRAIVYGAEYLVLGLGDVYLGAPVATPIDPRHRLVTTKYSPARTWTPANAVGIGGAYMCVYGMEGPGGYQLVGRTVPVWKTHGTDANFPDDPWLLRFFDRIRFVPVTAAELAAWRTGVMDGSRRLDITEGEFSMRDHRRFLTAIADDVARFRAVQQSAFAAERERWGLLPDSPESDDPTTTTRSSEPVDGTAVCANLAANVWRVEVAVGDRIHAGDVMVILEAMKMEISVTAPADGVVTGLACKPGDLVVPDQPLLMVRS